MAYIDNVNKVLNIQPEAAPTRVRLSQNENGRNLYFTLAGNENPIPSGVTVTISGTKPDGTVYSGTGSISNDVVLIPETVQLTAVAGVWDAKVKITSGGNTVATGRIRFLIDADTVAPGSVPSSSVLEGLVEQAQQYAETARQEAYGSPLTAALASDMTDKTRVYVYTGSESGYTAGHWYYWNGSAWTDGGVYNSTAVQTDKTLSLMDVPADGKAVGDAIATDKTLTISDAPADALVVGEKLAMIKEMIAGVEVTSTATKAYAIGDLVIVGDVLYKMTKAITSGTQIGSTNAQKTTIADVLEYEITDLKSKLYERIGDLDSEQTAIKGMIAGIESAYTATKNYNVGDLLIVESSLFKATAAIATGSQINASNVAATTIASVLTSLKGDLTDSFSKALYNKTFNPVLINGEQMTSQGVISENTNYSRTDYIDLDGVSTFQFNTLVDVTVGPINAMCFFNAEKIRISGETKNIVGIDINVPQNAKYVMYSGNTRRITGAEMTFKNLTSPTREIYIELDKKASVSDVFGDVFPNYILPIQNVRGISKYTGNLIDVEECVNNSYVNYSNGKFVYNQSAYFRTGYIAVEAGKTYKSNVGRNLAWYNSDKVYIDGAYGTGIQQGVTAPENAAFIVFSINETKDGITTPLDLYFAESGNYNLDVTIDGLVANPTVWVRHKKINWIGDSIVAGQDFDEEVCGALDLIKLYEYGINGSTISLNGDGTNTRNAICLRYANMSDDADIVAISAGTNDWMYAWAPIGDINSNDNTTFYGALKNLCEGLINKYPKKVIFFTTPIKRAQPFESGNGGEYTSDGSMTTPFSKNKYGKTLGDYADIIKEVCGYYSIPVLDMYRESLLNPHLTAQQDMFDSVYTHPNTTGQKIMARRVAGWINQLGYTIPNLT